MDYAKVQPFQSSKDNP